MKVLVSIDAEGLQGITFGTQVLPEFPEYELGKDVMNLSANAVVSGAFLGGAKSVDVVDAHNENRNLDIRAIDQRARVTLGWPKELSMVHGVDETDKLFLIGYHSRAGALKGVLSHTYSVNVHRLFVNEYEAGELWLSSAVASKFGVPVTMVAGDEAAVREGEEFLEDCEFVSLKTGFSRYAARSSSMKESLSLLENGAKLATKRKGKPLKVKEPVKIELEFQNSAMADNCMLVPGTERIDGYTIAVNSPDMVSAYKMFRVLVSLSGIDHGKY